MQSRFGVFTTDRELVVRTWDGFLEQITGIRANEALSRPVALVLPEFEQNGLLSILKQVAETGSIEVLAPALHHMRQRVTIGPVRVDGQISGVAVTIEDVTPPPAALGRVLDEDDWRRRQAASRGLAEQSPATVEALISTLREQHRNFNILSSLLDLLSSANVDVIGPLIACLQDQDADLRIQVALILGERKDQRAVPALIQALDDPDVNVRFHSIEALGALRATDAAPALVNIASSGDFFLGFPAVMALSNIGDVSVAPSLVPLLGDEMLRVAAAEALGQIGDELVVAPLVQLLNRPSAPTGVIAEALTGVYERYERRYRAGDLIAGLVRRGIGPTGTQNLLDAVQGAGPDRLAGIARVMGWLNGAAVQRALTRLLGQHAVRTQVVDALVRYGSGVVDLLIEQLASEDLDTRQAAVVALGRIGDRTATNALVARLHEPALAIPVAGALARLSDPDAFEPLLAMLGHADPAARQAAVAALNAIGHPDMLARVVPLLRDVNPAVRESAVRIAGYFGYPECADAMLERCADEVEAVRRASIDHLPFFEHPGVVPALVYALEFDTPAARASAAAALSRLDADVVTPLLKALGDAESWVRFFAVRSLGVVNASSAAPVLRRLIGSDPAAHVRLAAIDVLSRLDGDDALQILDPLSVSPDADVARAAIAALGVISDDAAVSRLEGLLRAPEAWRRETAATALGARVGPGIASTLQWTAAADDDESVARAAIVALGRQASSHGSHAIDALAALTAERGLREPAIDALAELGSCRIADIARGLRHASPDVRKATIAVLSRMKHPDATRSLETALTDSVPSVRAAAVEELRRLGTRHATKTLLTLARTDPDQHVRQAALLAVARRDALADGGRSERD